MLTVYVLRSGAVETLDHVDPSWLDDGQVVFWADMVQPTPEEGGLLATTFKFHDLAVEDALAERPQPKVESYPGFLYLVLHGIDFEASRHQFATNDIDFFLGRNFLVTVRDGRSRSIAHVADICPRNPHVLSEGPGSLLHRMVDGIVDNYRPEVDELDEWIDEVEAQVFDNPAGLQIRDILGLKRDVTSLRRVVVPQRDVVGRLARREFGEIDQGLAYRFRDVHDHLTRLADESVVFQDRITGLLEAHLAATSNRLNEVVKTLTIITVLFGFFTVLSGLYGMNVTLPTFPGGESAQFWWIFGLMVSLATGFGLFLRSRKWF